MDRLLSRKCLRLQTLNILTKIFNTTTLACIYYNNKKERLREPVEQFILSDTNETRNCQWTLGFGLIGSKGFSSSKMAFFFLKTAQRLLIQFSF